METGCQLVPKMFSVTFLSGFCPQTIRFVLHFEHVAFVFCMDPSIFVFERLLSCVKIALIANMVFSKTCLEVFIQVLLLRVVVSKTN